MNFAAPSAKTCALFEIASLIVEPSRRLWLSVFRTYRQYVEHYLTFADTV